MKISCFCGALIRDQTDSLPYKAHFVPDQDWDDVIDAVPDAIGRSRATSPRESLRRCIGTITNFTRLAWQCTECGRLFLEDHAGNTHVFLPQDARTSREIFHTRAAIRFADDETLNRALEYLVGELWARLFKSGELIVPLAAMEVLRKANLRFTMVEVPAQNPQSAIRNPQSRKPILGLIGGIGSGKSLVAAELARLGGRIIAGDQLGHEGLRQAQIKEEVVRRWGREVLDENGEVSRRRLGEKVFADPAERRALEALVFPYIERCFREEAGKAGDDSEVCFIILDAAVMLEAGWNKVCDRIVYVHAPRAQRLRRLAEQRGWSAKEVAARESAQMPLTEKASRADAAVDNSGSPEALGPQIVELLRSWEIPHRHGSPKIR